MFTAERSSGDCPISPDYPTKTCLLGSSTEAVGSHARLEVDQLFAF